MARRARLPDGKSAVNVSANSACEHRGLYYLVQRVNGEHGNAIPENTRPLGDDVFQVDPEAERKRLLHQQREDAIAAARQSLDDVAAQDSEQGRRALQILSTMERDAMEASRVIV